jgi:AraC-like DNA-binding protein
VVQTSTYLNGYALQTRNLDEAASLLAESAIPYVSELLPGSPAFSTEILVNHGHHVNLSRVVTSGLLRVKSRLPADWYAIVIDLGNGLGQHRSENHTIEVNSDTAFLQSPLQAVEVMTTPEYEALFVRVSRAALMEELQRMLDREPHTELTFSPALRLHTTAGKRLREICGSLQRMLTNEPDAASSLALRQLEGELITLLLETQTHNYTRLLRRARQSSNWQLDAAEQYMHSNAHLPLSLGDICKEAGVNARTLQHSFRRKRGCTPMQFLRNIRMEKIRHELLAPTGDTSVSGEAARWGFLHFGRFSGEYRQAFGELPSETLRRSRGVTSKPRVD